ncbi:hypothetical protein QP162_09025 [Sphingomonas aurantiaca]|uniref:hypothetical protein n=1 Tax=Sphingomonas aurantiaca TaxID=185949 RepID=UPI002FDFD5F4
MLGQGIGRTHDAVQALGRVVMSAQILPGERPAAGWMRQAGYRLDVAARKPLERCGEKQRRSPRATAERRVDEAFAPVDLHGHPLGPAPRGHTLLRVVDRVGKGDIVPRVLGAAFDEQHAATLLGKRVTQCTAAEAGPDDDDIPYVAIAGGRTVNRHKPCP